MLLRWPAPERNKVPILEVLQRVLPATSGRLLEVASGSGQHAAFLAAALPTWTWQPSDIDPENLASIAAHRELVGLPNLLAPRVLDVRQSNWETETVDAVFNANMIHIAPWECCEGLLRGSARALRASGVLVLYGPYRVAGEHTAESNRRFDADLRAQDVRWGVRDLEAVTDFAGAHGLILRERVAMPANNQCLVFDRS
jgi:SAM-dependent methyltransferase